MNKSPLSAPAAAFALPLLAALLTATPTSAQTVFRCGNSYSQTPCPAGATVDTADPRSAAQKSQTDAATRRDSRAADAMEKARLREQAQVAAASRLRPAASAASAPHGAASTAKHKRKTNHRPEPRDDVFVAKVPPAQKKSEKAP